MAYSSLNNRNSSLYSDKLVDMPCSMRKPSNKRYSQFYLCCSMDLKTDSLARKKKKNPGIFTQSLFLKPLHNIFLQRIRNSIPTQPWPGCRLYVAAQSYEIHYLWHSCPSAFSMGGHFFSHISPMNAVCAFDLHLSGSWTFAGRVGISPSVPSDSTNETRHTVKSTAYRGPRDCSVL